MFKMQNAVIRHWQTIAIIAVAGGPLPRDFLRDRDFEVPFDLRFTGS